VVEQERRVARDRRDAQNDGAPRLVERETLVAQRAAASARVRAAAASSSMRICSRSTSAACDPTSYPSPLSVAR
jgi:hypothetical protein